MRQTLARLYRKIDIITKRFGTAAGIDCPAQCTVCCTGFVPEVTAAEAAAVYELLAATGRSDHPTLHSIGHDAGPACPYYDAGARCTIYPARPLVCRLFAFAGVRTKAGALRFRLCRHMPGPEQRVYEGPALRDLAAIDPPDMGLAGLELAQLNGSAGDRPLPIGEAVFVEGRRAQLRRRLATQQPAAAGPEFTDDPPEHDPTTPFDPGPTQPPELRPTGGRRAS